MKKQSKPVVSFEDTFDKPDIRVGRIIEVELETKTHKPTYRMVIDFGKFGKREGTQLFPRRCSEKVAVAAVGGGADT